MGGGGVHMSTEYVAVYTQHVYIHLLPCHSVNLGFNQKISVLKEILDYLFVSNVFVNENHIQKHTESVIFQHFHVVCYHSVEVWRHIARIKEKIKYEQ